MNLWIAPPAGWSPLAAALLHSLWQAGLVGVLLAVTLRQLPASRSGFRATLSGTAQVAVLLMFVLTWAMMNLGIRSAPGDVPSESVRLALGGGAASVGQAAETRAAAPPFSRHTGAAVPLPTASERTDWSRIDWSRLVGAAWLAGAIFMLIRLVIDLGSGRRLAQTGRPVEPPLAAELAALGARLQLHRSFRAVWTDRLSVPAVYGAFRPVLLLPAAMMQVPPEHFEAIVAHELAHLKRFDWLWHLAGRIVEALLFFNPAVWWIGRLVRREREAAADSLAVAATHRPVVFARALADWPLQSSAAAAFGLAWTGDGGNLRDRVMRVLTPSEHPPICLSPSGLAAALLAAAIVLTGLWGGAQRVVAVAQELLSPAERIERVESVRQEVNRPEANPSAEHQYVTVSGTVLTADSQPLADAGRSGHGTVSIRSHFRRGPASGSGGYTGTVGASGKFSASVGEGEITVVADWEGYAPAMIGPLPSSASDKLKDVEVVLSRGFTGRVRLVGPEGEPVPEAELEAALDAPAKSQPRRYQSGADGVTTVEHAAPFPYALTVIAPGFQRETFEDVRLKPEEFVTLTLAPTEPATGTVTDPKGDPIANAELRLFASSPKPASIHSYGRTGAVLATTDAAGRFRIDTLPEDQRTVVLFAAEGHGSELRQIAAGQSDIAVQLRLERILRGEIVGDLSKLNRRYNGQSSLEYSVRVSLFESESEFERFHNLGDLAPVEPVETPESEPQRATFELRDLLPGELTITAGPAKRKIEPFHGLKEDVVIELDEPVSGGPARRTVVVRFVPPEPDAPPPTGDLRLDLKPLGDQAERRWEQFRQRIEDGRIEVEAFAPGTVSLQNQGMIGYWFDEAAVGLVDNYRAFRVPEGEGSFEFTIPVVPAGAIRGQTVAVDGSVPEDVRAIDLQCYRGASKRRGAEMISSATVHPNADGEFLITPVPLEGTYYIVASFGVTNVFSAPVVPTATQPVQKIAIRLPEFTSATVRVVDREDRPLADQKVQISRIYPGWFHALTSRRTDKQGRVTFPDLAADAIDQYQVSVIDERYRPLVEASLDELGRETTLTLPEQRR